MARIRTYALDNNVTGSDYWIGTDGNDNSNTKNFSPNSVAQYLNENEIIDVSNSVRFRYDTIDSGQQRKDGTISFQNEIGATVPMNQLSSFILSKKTQSGKDVSFFLNVLPTTKVILHKADDINLFGLYKVLSVITDILEPNFFNVSLEFISGHGSIEEDKDYIISLIDLNKTIPVLQLTKETFNYVSSSSFTLSNTIGNILQVIINTTSLHPEGYSYTLPSTVTILNELYVGDVVTIVYNYLEEFFEVPDLQKVTTEGNHTTNDIIIDGIQGVYTTTNTITDEGSFNSATSVGSYQYQSEYLVDEMSINEVSTSNEDKSVYIVPGLVSSTLTHPLGFNAVNISVGTSTTSPSLNLFTELGSGRILIDNVVSAISLQFPIKPTGTYTIATTSDVIPFNPAEYDLDEFTNTNIDPFAKISDISVLVAGKMNNPSLTASYIPKALTATTIGNSRLLDTGTYLGIDSISPLPLTKDIQLGRQNNKEIGIEQSDAFTNGMSLSIKAGRTIDFQENTNLNLFNSIATNRMWGACNGIDGSVFFNDYSATPKLYYISLNESTPIPFSPPGDSYGVAITQAPNGDLYKSRQGAGLVYKLPYGGSVWASTGLTLTNNNTNTLASGSNGDIFAFDTTGIYIQVEGTGPFTLLQSTVAVGGCRDYSNNVLAISGGVIWKRTNNTGLFVSTGVSCTGNYITVSPNGNVYTVQYNGSLYVQYNGTGSFVNLLQTARQYNGIASDGNSNIFVFVDNNGGIYKLSNGGTGTSNLNGGTLKLVAGTGKGTGQSRLQLITGAITTSGTTLQTETVGLQLDETGLVTIPAVTNALIEADTTGKAVVTKEYVNNRLVVETASPYTLTNADSGGIVIFTASTTLTIPTGLADGFECTFVTLSGVTLTVVSTGNTLNNATSTTMLPQLSFTLKRMLAANTYIVAGSL